MTKPSNLKPETLAAQALGWIEPAMRGVVPPIHLATTFERAPDYTLPAGRSYIRDENPTLDQPEALLATLEGGAAAALFASGNAAAVTAFQALAPGDHVVAPAVMYWGLRHWLVTEGRRWGLRVALVDATDPKAIAAAVEPGRTKLVWIETPANPDWGIADIAAAAEVAHKAGARLAVDNTTATPVLTRPLALGADLVMHSATKYLNGHSDVLGGALVTAAKDDYWSRIGEIRHLAGAMLGSFEAWLILRGMRTLFLRVRAASASAQRIAEHFAGHPKLERVLYPGLPDHPNHAVARRQMQGGFSGMLSIRVKGGAPAALKLASRVGLWVRATSLGGPESLIEHRKSVESADSPVAPDLLRLSVGLEDAGDLIADLEDALAGL
jgi:cystathionine gamma-synthase